VKLAALLVGQSPGGKADDVGQGTAAIRSSCVNGDRQWVRTEAGDSRGVPSGTRQRTLTPKSPPRRLTLVDRLGYVALKEDSILSNFPDITVEELP